MIGVWRKVIRSAQAEANETIANDTIELILMGECTAAPGAASLLMMIASRWGKKGAEHASVYSKRHWNEPFLQWWIKCLVFGNGFRSGSERDRRQRFNLG
jgi:hypothetical protein